MTVLVTGASGLVGAAVATQATAAGLRVHAIAHRFPGPLPEVASWLRIDLSTDDAIAALFAPGVRYDAIIHAAAISEPAQCDADPELSHRLNVVVPARLAEVCGSRGVRFIHISTEQVFGGDRAPYRRDDPPYPLNLYARQKVESEAAVVSMCPGCAVVRAPLLMGNSPGGRRSLHERLLLDWSAGRTPRLFTDEIRQVCTAENLASALLELAFRPELAGVFNWGGAEALSRWDLGIRIRDRFGLPATAAPLVAVTRAEVPGAVAQRAANLAMDLAPLSGELLTPVETFDQQLAGLRCPPALQDWLDHAKA